ncbi:hypothetical protein RDI58_017605 [Solanum bulbocastanum]|uniref:Uncharacterized protein n=1 Tax=Solanum bulbocastanum TaxID=147425 RepID=A0AAN8YA51_SOLBU
MRRTQENINNRTKQNMPHTEGSKSIATLMDEKAVNDSAKVIDMINEKMSNSERSTDQDSHRVAWKCDVYSHVMK